MFQGRLIVAILLILGVMAFGYSCTHQPYVMPESQRTNDPNICFERDVLPIFISNCAKSGCHDAASHESGYVLDNYAHIMKKGIVPGNSAASKIWLSVTLSNTEGGKMPQNGPALNGVQLDVIKRWIVTGAVDSGACTDNCDSNNITYSGGIAPMMQLYCVGCHNSASASGGSLADYNSVMTAAVTGRLIGDVADSAGYNHMPKGGSSLSACQVTQIRKWVAAGAPNN